MFKNHKKEDLSSFYIPISFSKTDLEKTLNSKIDGVIFDDKLSEDNLLIILTKVDTISLSLKDTTINYKVPLHIWVKKEFVLGGVAAEGDIALFFQTTFTLHPDWTISTITQIVDYEWIIEPKANVLGVKIPIKSVAERVLNTSKKNVTNAIDAQINKNFSLKEYAQQAWDLLQQPIPVSEEYELRFSFRPMGFAISPFKTEKDIIICTLYLQGTIKMNIGQPIIFPKHLPLLPLKIQDFEEKKDFSMNLISEIPLVEIQKVADKNLKGQTFNYSKISLLIEDIKLSKEGELVEIGIKTKGDYNGFLFLKGIPSFNPSKNQLTLKEVSFNLDTNNILLKSAKWLLNGWLTNKLAGGLTYSLGEDLTNIQGLLQKQLSDFKIQEGVDLKGEVAELKIEEAVIVEESIYLKISLKGRVRVVAG